MQYVKQCQSGSGPDINTRQILLIYYFNAKFNMSLALIGPSTAYSIHTTQKCALTVNGGNDNLSA